jgi:uncharacterized membrane protein
VNRFANHKDVGIILAIVLGEVVVVVLALALGGAAARVVAALPLVLVLPGYALTLALFPGRALGWAERALFSLGLSLAVVALGGLALHLTPWGLRPATWAVLLVAITLAAGAVGLVRRRAAAPAADPARPAGGLTVAQATLFALAAVVLSGALALTVRGAQEQETVGFTQVWMVEASPTNQARVRLGVSNREPSPTQFRLQLVVEGQARQTWTLQLAPDQTWETAVDLPADLAPTADVEGVLYRGDAPDVVYRRVKLGREP